MTTFFTVVFFIIGAISALLIWAIAESDNTSDGTGFVLLFCVLSIICSGVGLYYCGTLMQVLELIS